MTDEVINDYRRSMKQAERRVQQLEQRKNTWKRRCYAMSGLCAVFLVLSLVSLTYVTISRESKIEVEVKYPKLPSDIQPTSQVSPTPNHVLASVKLYNPGKSVCGATVISRGTEYAAIVGCAHCYVGNIGGTVQGENADGSKFTAELLAVDRKRDLSLFRAPAGLVLAHSWIPRDVPSSVRTWDAAGYTAGGKIQYKTLRPLGTYYCDNHQTRHAKYYVTNDAPFAAGDSGGGIFADGALVGVISGTQDKNRYGVDSRGNRVEVNKHNKYMSSMCDHGGLIEFVKSNKDKLRNCGPYGCRPGPRYPITQKPDYFDPRISNIPIVLPRDANDREKVTEINKLWEYVKELETKVTRIKVAPGVPGNDGRDGKDGKDGEPGRDGKDGMNGLNGKDGRDGKDATVDYGIVQKIVDGAVKKGIEDLELLVEFEAGDEDDEPKRTVRVKIVGGKLVIPSTKLRIRNIDESGQQVGPALFDTAPLGNPLKLRIRPPVVAKQ